MKFDMLDQYLPWRYLVGQIIQTGNLPLWNPYTHLGYQLYADPQSGAWYPASWIIGGLYGYNIYWIQVEYLFHVWIAGCGMYLLVDAVIKNKNVAWIAGASYLLSGFFSGNAQHLTWIISGAWLPFLLYYFLLIYKTEDWRNCLRCALIFFMLVTGGYPAFTVVTVYVLILLSAVAIGRKIYFKRAFKLNLLQLGLFIVVALMLSTVMLVSVSESFLIAGRAEGLSRELAMENPFSPQALLSWILPFGSVKDSGFFQTDTSMSNGYFGLIMLTGLLISFFRKKSFIEMVILTGSIFFLLAAMGRYTPLRGWLYDFIPLMNLFRMPSLFRLFAIIGFILCSSYTLKWIFDSMDVRKQLAAGLKIIGLILMIATMIFFFHGFKFGDIVIDNYIDSLQALKLNESMVIQGIIQLACIAMFIFLIKKNNISKLLIIDGILACWLCAPVTIVSNLKAKELYDITNQFPATFRVPELTPMIQNKDRTGIIGPFWCNLGIWKKQPIYDGYNNFQTKKFLRFESSSAASSVLKNPIIYESTAVREHSGSESDSLMLLSDSTLLFVQAPLQKKFKSLNTDVKQLSKPVLLSFSPSKIEAIVDNKGDCYFTLMQQYDERWRVFVDGRENPKFETNGFFISTMIPAGKHEISFLYTDQKIKTALNITIISLLLTIVVLVVSGARTTRDPSPYS